jgi:aerobic carbon-monoxide dehydrogenase large subunit
MAPMQSKFGIGQPVRRVEDKRFITGKGRYVDDIVLPRMAHGAVLLSPHAHARIAKLDVTAAREAPGVLCVLTGADLAAQGIGSFPPLFMPEDMGGPKGYRTARPVLATDRVIYAGDRVAFVVAESAAQARDALELIEMDYDVLPALPDVEAATAPGAPAIWEGAANNVSVALAFGDEAATEAAFQSAAHRISLKLVNNRLAANPIEPRACIGLYEDGPESFTLYATSQNPHGGRQMLAGAILHIPETRLRVISPDVGGGFGMKADPYPEDALVLIAARAIDRPVKWVSTRSEGMLTDTNGRDQVVLGELALDADGHILAIRADAKQNIGAYVAGACMAPLVFSLRFIPSVYDVKTIFVRASAVFTHTAPLGPYRGAGRPEANYLIERLVERAAAELGIDPVEFRRRNLIRSTAMPHLTPTFYNYDSGDFLGLMDATLQRANWDGFPARAAQSRARGKLRGRGMGIYIEQGGIFNERMELRFDPSGNVTVIAGTHSHGQGHATVFSQMAAEWLGLPFENVRFVQGDTDAVPIGRGTYAARSSLVGGCALKAAAELAIEKAKRMAAHLLEAAETDLVFEDGRFSVAGTDKAIPMTDVVKAFYRPAHLPPGIDLGLEAAGTYDAEIPNFPNGCHACEVEVDPETGAVEIVDYTVTDDTGRPLNPLIVEGQIVGGLAQGLGQALMEVVRFDRQGQLLTGTFNDYCMPRADDIPNVALAFRDTLCKTNPLGIKGVGESGTIGAPVTVINAVMNALGVREMQMPATPLTVWEATRAAA